jgi:hypothetical protein
MYVLWLFHRSALFTQSQSCKTEKKLTHGELHGTVSVRMPLLVSFPLHEKLLISANHFITALFFFGDASNQKSITEENCQLMRLWNA